MLFHNFSFYVVIFFLSFLLLLCKTWPIYSWNFWRYPDWIWFSMEWVVESKLQQEELYEWVVLISCYSEAIFTHMFACHCLGKNLEPSLKPSCLACFLLDFFEYGFLISRSFSWYWCKRKYRLSLQYNQNNCLFGCFSFDDFIGFISLNVLQYCFPSRHRNTTPKIVRVRLNFFQEIWLMCSKVHFWITCTWCVEIDDSFLFLE